MSDEATCDQLCQDEQMCEVYTYHTANKPTLPETCYLLTSLGEPIRECEGDTCVSGLPNCEGSICAFMEGGVKYPEGILVTGEDKNIELLTLGTCPSPVAIAIGGGGNSARDTRGGGGGSGYVNYTSNFPLNTYIKMAVHPGGLSDDSYVRDLADNTYIIRAERGRIGKGSPIYNSQVITRVAGCLISSDINCSVSELFTVVTRTSLSHQ